MNTDSLKHRLQYIGRSAVYALVVILFLFVTDRFLPHVNTRWMSLSKQTIAEKIQFTDLYLYFHRQTAVPMMNGRQVLLVDIHPYQTREEVADLLDSIAQAKPYCVALDVLFGNIAMPDSAVNSHLTNAARKLPNLILASEQRPIDERHYRHEHSFFANEVDAREALVNFKSADIIRYWNPKLYFDGDTFPSFASAIIEQVGLRVPSDADEWLIDYSIVDTTLLRPWHESFNWDFLRDQIVLVGDAYDLRDIKTVPFSYRISTRIAGVQIHKQIVQTAMAGHWFKRIHEVWKWVIAFILLCLLELSQPFAKATAATIWPSTENSIDAPAHKKWGKTVERIYQLSIIVCFLAFGYFLFWGAHLYFDMFTVLIIAPATLWLGKWIVGRMGQWIKRK